MLAFLSAEGYGKYTRGGRGGAVYGVTTLNDSGDGSLRAAVEAERPRDETLSVYHNSHTTIQYCVISEAIEDGEGHKFGGIWGDDNSTYHHNLFARHESRNPRFASGAGHVDFRNNVVYNWVYNSVYGGEKQQPGDAEFDTTVVNMVANYYKPGPATEPDVRDRIVEPSSRGSDDEGRWYVAENVVVGDSEVTAENWQGVDGEDYVRLDESWPAVAIGQETAEEAYKSVIEEAGATLPARDAVDARIVEEVRSGRATYGEDGIISTQSDVGGWSELESVSAPPDSDHDGMPDRWKRRNGLDPNDPSDRNEISDNGYTMLEKILE